MNKKTIAALVLGTFIMSASATSISYAAGLQIPGEGKLGKLGDEFSDSDKANKAEKEKKVTVNVATKTELKYDYKEAAKMKHEGKLYVDGRIDDMWTAEVGLNIETKTDNSKQSETEKWEMENVWLEYKKTPEFSAKFGRQTYHLAKGLYIDQDGVFGGKAIYKLDKDDTLELFAARDDQDRTAVGPVWDQKSKQYIQGTASETTLLEVINWAHKFNHGAIGTYFAKQGRQDGDTDRFWGLYGHYGVAHRTDFNFEYLKNNFTDTRGYVAELKYGKLKKAGDFTYALEYMDADKNLMETNGYTDFDSQLDKTENGFKGPGAIIMNKISKNSQIQLQRWWGRDKGDTMSLPITKLILYVKF